MSRVTVYLTGLVITLIISLILFLFFRPYLKKILLELNGEKERPANFWVIYSGIILFLLPLVFAMTVYPESDMENYFFQLSKQIKWSLIGVIIVFFSFGIAIIRFVPKNNGEK